MKEDTSVERSEVRDKLLIQRSVTRIEPASGEGESLHKLEEIAHVPLLSPEAANLIEILAAVEVASESGGAAGAREAGTGSLGRNGGIA